MTIHSATAKDGPDLGHHVKTKGYRQEQHEKPYLSSDNQDLQRAVRKMRARGSNLKELAKHFGISMETARSALFKSDRLTNEKSRTPEPLPAGHSIAMRGLWRGLEHWRDFADAMNNRSRER